MWHGTETVLDACCSRESRLLGTGSRAGKAANQLFPCDGSQEQTCLSKRALGRRCLFCYFFLEGRLKTRKFSVVCKSASSCYFSLPLLSVGRRTLGCLGEAFLGVSCRAGMLSWLVVYQLCWGDLCCSLATETRCHSWVYSGPSLVTTTGNFMDRFRSTRLSRQSIEGKPQRQVLYVLYSTLSLSFFCFLCYMLVCHFHLSVIWLDGSVFFFVFCRIKAWVDKMQEDLVTLARTASGVDWLAQVRRCVLDCCN